ncbi:hypothetical protein MAR_026039 [Mya arenaria]|uniref:HAT C-terminal dimerisation domain-containing protein n=1 Tax=Mya arenaria TaxID=6604 RepID=A0ABY7ESF0_MYAAR|nr:hypothetical protein MAR_026039 [Mya arenaria]
MKWPILSKKLCLLPEISMLKSYFKSRLKQHRKQVSIEYFVRTSKFGSLSVAQQHDKLTEYSVRSLVDHYQDDMPQPEKFQQELQLWKRTWGNKEEKPGTITETLSETCNFMYPNIIKNPTLMMLTSVTSASVERSNS